MPTDYRSARLTDDDLNALAAMEQDLTRKHGRAIVLVAYEKASDSPASAHMEVGFIGDAGPDEEAVSAVWTDAEPPGPHIGRIPHPRVGTDRVPRMGDTPERGATFGFADPQFDGHPTLADITSKHDDHPDALHRSVDEKEVEGKDPSRREDRRRRR